MLFISLKKPEKPIDEADGYELRLDSFPSLEKNALQAFCQTLSKPIIFTLRKQNFQGSEEERLSLFEGLLSLGPDYADIEFDTDPAFIKKVATQFPNIKIILSYHNFVETPKDLLEILNSMRSPHAYAYKLATLANSVTDSLYMLHFVKTQKDTKLSGICMGVDGEITRILGPVFGNFIDYAPVSELLKTASGQLPVSELYSTYHYKKLNQNTAIYGLIGDPVDKSVGHLVHNGVFVEKGFNAVYVRMKVKREELSYFFNLAKVSGIKGLSVTMPLKELLFDYLDHNHTQEINAVNTLVFKDHQISGYDTDGIGALDALEYKTSVKGKKIIILGAGGAARAIAYEALKRGAELLILNRTKDRAIELANDLGCQGGGLEQFTKENYDIVINATPDSHPINPEYLIPNKIVMDIVSLPKLTPFLLHAQEKNCILVFGYEMWIEQARQQLFLWFGKKVEKEALEKYLI